MSTSTPSCRSTFSSGSSELREQIEAGQPVNHIADSWAPDLERVSLGA